MFNSHKTGLEMSHGIIVCSIRTKEVTLVGVLLQTQSNIYSTKMDFIEGYSKFDLAGPIFAY